MPGASRVPGILLCVFVVLGRKFHALFVLGMMILAAMFTGGCGGSNGGSVGVVNNEPSPTPIVSQDPTPNPRPTPTPIISQDPIPSPTPVPVTSTDPVPTPSPVPVVSTDPTPSPTPAPVILPDPTLTQFTVTFDSQGGSEVSAQIVKAGSNAEVPDEPYKDESSFMGWYPSEGFAFRFDFSTPISQDTTLYAKWWDSNDTTDSDNDGMPDLLEMTYGTDPYNPDTDDDGLTDWDEMNWLGYNPLAKDTDGNGVNDGDEDADGDDLTNILEGNYGTNMIAKDTDHDDLSDYDEVMTYRTDPVNADTDGDGVNDGLEIVLGSDPLTAETSFTTALHTDNVSENPQAIDISVSMKSSAEAAGTLSILPASLTGNPFISRFIPGYLAAYELNADASFDSAQVTFTLGSEAGTIGTDFQPAIYRLKENTGILRKVEGQRIEGNKIIAEVSHFSMYVLLNSVEFDRVWSVDIRPPSSGSTSSEDMRLDIVFVIDYSASMSWNDSSQIFKTLSKNFVSKLRDGKDRGAVVKFIRIAQVISELTADKDALNTAIDSIEYDDGNSTYSGTNGSEGLNSALNILEASSSGYKYIVFLTDGEDTNVTYSYASLIDRAKNAGIYIYAIGLGTANETLLTYVASGTGGVYYKATAATSSQEVLNLEEVYKQIAEEAIDMTTDSNNDGITDYYTRLLHEGLLTINGVPLFCGVLSMDFTDSSDWDGDGLKNGEEISIEVDRYGIPYINIKSNPLLVDSDSDGYSDPAEINKMGTSPLKFMMLPGDFNQLIMNSGYPVEYVNYSIPGSDNFWVNLAEEVVKAFAGDKQKRAKEAFINYFYDYSTSTEILSRDADATERRTRNQDIIDGLHLASNFIKMCKSAGDLLETTRSGKYTLSEQTKKKAEEAIDETNKAMAKMLRVKKVDIDKLNSPWRNIAEGIRTDKIDYVVQKAEVSAIREEAKNIFEALNSLSSAIKDFKETENGGQILSKIFEYSPLVLGSVSTAAQTLSAFNKIELPCKWEWLKKASAERKTAGGRTLPSNITVVLTGLEVGAVALDTAAEYVRVADTYGKIEANYAEYQKYLDLLRSIEQDEFFPDYVRNGAGEIAGMFSKGGDPKWDEFDKRVQAAQRKEIALGHSRLS